MTQATQQKEGTRRDFIVLAANTTAGLGAVAVAWPFIDALNPAADVLAMASTEVDISAVQPGQNISVMWRGKPVFIRRRTQAEIEAARRADSENLIDPQKDADRVLEGKEEWLVAIGICTHLGCVPVSNAGEYNGWFCPCHGSHYDTAGRIRTGPAPENLAIPPFEFISDTRIKIG